MKRLFRYIILSALLAVGQSCYNPAVTAVPYADNESQRIPDIYEQTINKLIAQLGADDWHLRESAHTELLKMGEGLIQEYSQVFYSNRRQKIKVSSIQDTTLKTQINKLANILLQASKNNDLEIAIRANRISRHLYAKTLPRLVFSSGQDSNSEIYLMDANGDNRQNLTDNRADALCPVWSPDATKVVFMSNRGGNVEIYVMDSDGRNQKNLTNNKADDISPSWSPDGSKIAFASNRDNGNWGIYIMDADGGNPIKIVDNAYPYYGEPAWSPDGSEMTFTYDRDGKGEIYRMNRDGSNQRNLTNNPAWDCRSWWNPDGIKIMFVSFRDGNDEVYIMDVNGRNQKNLTQNPAYDRGPAWSPDGSRIAFVSGRDGNDETSEIYVMDTDGGNIQRLTVSQPGTHNRFPSWEPFGIAELSELFNDKDK